MNVSPSVLPSVHPCDLLALFPGLRHVAHVVQVVVAQLCQSLGRHGDLLVLSSHVNGQKILLYFIVHFPKVVLVQRIYRACIYPRTTDSSAPNLKSRVAASCHDTELSLAWLRVKKGMAASM